VASKMTYQLVPALFLSRPLVFCLPDY